MRDPSRPTIAPLVSLADITEIELVILKRMREVTIGDHRSRSHGSGLRLPRPARLAGRRPVLVDRLGAVDADEFLAADRPRVRAAEHGDGGRDRRRLALDAVRHRRRADRRGRSRGRSRRSACRRCSSRIRSASSPSTRASRTWPASGRGPARATSSTASTPTSTQRGLQPVKRDRRASATTLGGYLRSTVDAAGRSPTSCSTMPEDVLRELALLNATHDVFLVLIDSAFAFELPPVSAGLDRDRRRRDRTRAHDLAPRRWPRLAERVRDWQDDVQHGGQGARPRRRPHRPGPDEGRHRAERVRRRAAAEKDV